MATSRLELYNGALLHLKERKLSSLSEDREPRRVLDDVWDARAQRYCLEQGLWNFATRSLLIDYSPSVEPSFGFRRAFDKPADWVRTSAISADEYFRSVLLAEDYLDEAGYWWADLDQLYVRVVSDDASYGGDYSLWPETFTRWVECWLAWRAAPRIAATEIERLSKLTRKLLVDARSKDAQSEGTAFLPSGFWRRARAGRTGRDRGSRSRLIG